MPVVENPGVPGRLPKTGMEPNPPAGFVRYRFLAPHFIDGIGLVPAGDVRELSGYYTGGGNPLLINDVTGLPA